MPVGERPLAKLRSVCVFCGSSSGTRPEYAEHARELGRLLAEQKIRLVYGGGNVGLMGCVADAVLQNGGEVLGVIPQMLAEREVAYLTVTELRVVQSMHERKAIMAEESDAFVALPGGIGTFEELFEVFTWAQLAIHQKPIGLLNSAGYYSPLLTFLEYAVTERFMTRATHDLLRIATTPAELLEKVAQPATVAEIKPFDRRLT